MMSRWSVLLVDSERFLSIRCNWFLRYGLRRPFRAYTQIHWHEPSWQFLLGVRNADYARLLSVERWGWWSFFIKVLSRCHRWNDTSLSNIRGLRVQWGCASLGIPFVLCDEEIWHPNTFDRQRTIVVSKNYRIVSWREAVALSHPPNYYKAIRAWESLTPY